MSCENCEKVHDSGAVVYIRVGNANVGISGCDIHAGHVIRVVNAARAFDEVMNDVRVVARVKGEKS